MDRRTFLLLTAAAVGTSGCTDGSADPRPSASAPRPSTDPDQALRRRVAESEAALIAAYRTALATVPELAPTLEPILRHHSEHLARVAPDGAPSPPADASPAPAPSGPSPGGSTEAQPSAPPTTTGPGSAAPTPSADPAEALSDLAAAETAARDERIAACDAAVDAALARELCLIGASEAQHAAVLAGAASERTP